LLSGGEKRLCTHLSFFFGITRHSNFVNFPIKIDGEVVNTVQALWTKPAAEVTEEQYKEFYRFVGHSFDEPTYRLHFRSDAPIDLKVCYYSAPTAQANSFSCGESISGAAVHPEHAQRDVG
jgi:HSP90 family molecular chaperone